MDCFNIVLMMYQVSFNELHHSCRRICLPLVLNTTTRWHCSSNLGCVQLLQRHKSITTYLQFTFTCLIAQGCLLSEWNCFKAEKSNSHPQTWNTTVPNIHFTSNSLSSAKWWNIDLALTQMHPHQERIHFCTCDYIYLMFFSKGISCGTSISIPLPLFKPQEKAKPHGTLF